MYEKGNGLPEVIRQIGEISVNSNVYIEDYAYSYLRKLKQQAIEEPMRAAMYGRTFQKEGKCIYLIYGVAPIEDMADSFFSDYKLLGYVNFGQSRDEIKQQKGCYVFCENNDAMQEYLLAKQKKQDFVKGQDSYVETKRRDGDRIFIITQMIQKLLLTIMLLIAVMTVVIINHYDRMCEFAMMIAKAAQQIR